MLETKKQYLVDDAFIKEFRRLQRWQRNFRGTGVTNTPEGATILIQHPRERPPEEPPRILRMRVTDADAGPDVVLAKRTDGVDVFGEDIPVRVYWQRAVDEELYAYRPAGGTDAVYDGQPVRFVEVYTLGIPEFQGMVVQAVTQEQAGWDFVRAYALPGA